MIIRTIMRKMLFASTKGGIPPVTFREALLEGQPKDYGLYMPVSIPSIPAEEIESFRRMKYRDIAYRVIYPYVEGSICPGALKNILKEIYDFDIPLQRAGENLHLLWLTRGPTASFKDFAARFMSGIIGYFAMEDNAEVTILVATSGDTGGAVAKAFGGNKNVKVVILFPEEEVTPVQRKQMTTPGRNIIPFAVRGKFDDCQAMAKRAFNDRSLGRYNLVSANSINFGRLLPQAVYYFYAFSRMDKEKVVFSVPSGNFGNLMGGLLAMKMGLPVEKFIAAVNLNDEFPSFLETGTYRAVVPSRQCSSNAMNVGHPSNLARLVSLYGGLMSDERDREGNVTKRGALLVNPDMEKMRNDLISYSIGEDEADRTIVDFWHEKAILLEPHGAVAVSAARRYKGARQVISIETADPAKFPVKIRELLGIDPPVPESLRSIDGLEEKYYTLDNDYDIFREKFTGMLS